MALKHAQPGEVVDLRPLGSRIGETKTSAILRTPEVEAVRLVVRAGTEIRCTRHPGDGRLRGVIEKTDLVDWISQCSGASCTSMTPEPN